MKNTTKATILAKIAVLTCLAFAQPSCYSVNSALTPSIKVLTDDFDGSKVIYQKPVSSSSKLTEHFHTLGFDWTSKTPNRVFLSAGAPGITNIYGLSFNVDGTLVSARLASNLTEYGDWSTRRFYVSYSDFVKLANAQVVKMKVTKNNTYTVSSFGKSTSAVVNKKMTPFLAQVHQAVK